MIAILGMLLFACSGQIDGGESYDAGDDVGQAWEANAPDPESEPGAAAAGDAEGGSGLPELERLDPEVVEPDPAGSDDSEPEDGQEDASELPDVAEDPEDDLDPPATPEAPAPRCSIVQDPGHACMRAMLPYENSAYEGCVEPPYDWCRFVSSPGPVPYCWVC